MAVTNLVQTTHELSSSKSDKSSLNSKENPAVQLSDQSNDNEHRSSRDENIDNPFQVMTDGCPPKSYWIHHYRNDSPILQELYFDVIDQPRQIFKSIFNGIKALFGNDPYEKQIEKWSISIQSLIDQSLHSSSRYSDACDLLQIFKEMKNIEPLLKLHTLHKDFCEAIGKSRYKTDCLFAPIDCHLYTITNRAYQGDCYRGLTMSKDDFGAYQYALENPRSYVRTNTFSSSSTDLSMAEGFSRSGDTEGKMEVLMKFYFAQPCRTAICLFENLPYFQSISFYGEFEVLILPGTIFSVKKITQDEQTQHPVIHLEYFDTVEIQAETSQDRSKSFVDTFILDY